MIITAVAVGTRVLLLVILLFLAFHRDRRRPEDPYEDMEGRDFEYYCADILKERG